MPCHPIRNLKGSVTVSYRPRFWSAHLLFPGVHMFCSLLPPKQPGEAWDVHSGNAQSLKGGIVKIYSVYLFLRVAQEKKETKVDIEDTIGPSTLWLMFQRAGGAIATAERASPSVNKGLTSALGWGRTAWEWPCVPESCFLGNSGARQMETSCVSVLIVWNKNLGWGEALEFSRKNDFYPFHESYHKHFSSYHFIKSISFWIISSDYFSSAVTYLNNLLDPAITVVFHLCFLDTWDILHHPMYL